jgi:hypothetical protein
MNVHFPSFWKFLFCLILFFAILGCQTVKPKPGLIHTIRVRHVSDQRAYEDHKARVGEEFFIADTEYTAKVKRFVPDFVMNKKTKEVSSRSDLMNNPALLLEVLFQNRSVYETWILYQNPMPHKIHDPGYFFQYISYEKAE